MFSVIQVNDKFAYLKSGDINDNNFFIKFFYYVLFLKLEKIIISLSV